ncbi:MAG: hypothetical protein HY658_01405 [Actinobacteria bacterium]|nr:hypothetical protein [Actinomycetota bacterium]
MRDDRSGSGRWTLGLVLIVLGVLFLLDSLNVLDDPFGRLWPVILIAIGAWLSFSSGFRNLLGPILLFLGVGFLLSQLDVIDDDWIGRWGWPVILILIGLWFVLRRPLSRRPSIREDWFDVMAMIGGRRETVTSREWRGGEATAFMGGVEIDLRDALPVADGARVEATAFMGGIEIYVPRTWVVTVKGVPILGSVEDHTRVSRETDETQSPDPDLPRLQVRATAIMGSVEIKHG